MHYLLRSYSIPADLEDEVTAELWACGTLGVHVVGAAPFGGAVPETGRVRVEAYFPGPEGSGARAVLAAPTDPAALGTDPLAGWATRGVESLGALVVPDQDWLAPWREKARPFVLGRGFRVDPREPEERDGEEEEEDGRRLLRLPARAAFGVGSHESTRLAVELLEDLPLAGRSVVDVGTGTGILAFAALHLGARRAVAFDFDPASVVAALDNAVRNRLYPYLFCGTAGALAPAVRFDHALVNIVPELILPTLPDLARRVDGCMVLSGILVEKGDEVLAAVAEMGFRERARRVAGEWIGFVVERKAGGEDGTGSENGGGRGAGTGDRNGDAGGARGEGRGEGRTEAAP